MPLHHSGAAHRCIRRECGFRIEIIGIDRFVRDRLPGKGRLIDIESHSLKKMAIGRHFIAGIQYNHITDNHFLFRYFGNFTVAHHLHRLIVIHLVEKSEFLVGLVFKKETKTGGKQYGGENTYRLEKHLHTLVKRNIFINGDGHGKHSGHQQNDNQRVGKFFEEQFPQRFLFSRGKYIFPMLLPAFQHFAVSEAGNVLVLAHK